MDDGGILAWTETERLSFADLLESLDEQDWSAKTLCTEWTVRAMAGHLAQTTRNRLKDTLVGIVKAKGDWDRMNTDQAIAYGARFSPAELVAQIREDAGSARRSPGAKPIDPLADVLIHGQDVARPLGIARPMPEEPAIAALEHLLVSPFWGAKKRCKGLRLIATDAGWTGGTGPEEVRGPLVDLLLSVSGRSTGLATLTGPGAALLGSR
ncbi:maleylpyruvate isomerase family mycothiol-dependent enzyme [Amycolatopsis sp. WAC 04169]|uniref:maleylpyruvate isomerase family mycothiol-dependent enzyme n=1 Tax=Amycolatopsis sp. WAC 04169 TaxID=2203197 RepID=UPI000F784647|nr:maleylpyruvate isomerase family mycothiol-dependent enzyme [Amycolatopsis sp. WAC 04169]RSN35127.1 maleylpyruvate isomerase family mycothiol-dependent enzyme [Amycolatopsis sp. WAC 04169]